MLTKTLICGISLFCLSYATHATANPLSPGAPVTLINTANIQNPPVVSGTASGFMVVSMDGSNLESTFSTDGTTWTSPVITFTNSYTSPWVSGTTAGFLATFIAPAPGYTTASPYSLFSNDNGATWGSDVIIEVSGTVSTPVVVFGTTAGFMAVWDDVSDSNAYSTFSVDNGSTWSTPVQITTSGALFRESNHNTAVIVTATTDGFVATWLQSDFNAYASFSNNNGSTWSAPVPITNTADVNSDVLVSANSVGFMAVWANDAGVAFSSFSSDNGSSWTAPSQIATDVIIGDLDGGPGADVTVSGASSGFVVAWIGQDNNAYGSFSSDNGTTWSDPAQITTDGNVSVLNNAFAFGYVSVCAVDNTCVFTWIDSDENVLASFSTIGGSSSAPRSFTRPCSRRGGS